MSDQSQRKIPLAEVADLVSRGGDFNVNDSFAPARDAAFTPWNKSSFKPVEKKPEPRAAEPEPELSAQAEPAPAEIAHAPAPPPPPPPPPPEPEEPAPTPAEILAAIDKAREDGRALGYQQGLEATRKELGDTLSVLRKLEGELNSLAQDAFERNAEIMAHHVRRLAQELFGAVFAEMPETFVERIKTAAEMFTKAGSEFTLSLNPHDAMTLETSLKGVEIFQTIRIVENDDIAAGAFRLSSRDLEFDDFPQIDEPKV